MGLFDKVLGGGSEKFSESDGVAGIAIAAVAADGVITQEEAAGLGTTLSRMNLFQGMSSRDINKTFEKVLKVAQGQGVDKLLELSSAAIGAELKPTAFAIAADLVLADGHVAGAEKTFLEKIQKHLGVDDALALKVVEVIAIKNRG